MKTIVSQVYMQRMQLSVYAVKKIMTDHVHF